MHNQHTKDILRRFTEDPNLSEALIEFLQEHVNDVALERMYKKEDVAHIADAWSLIQSGFDNIKQIYGIPKPKRKQKNEAK